MPATGGIIVRPGKRWVDSGEPITLADLDATASPIMEMERDSVGIDELIADDVIELLDQNGAGRRGTLTFPIDVDCASNSNNIVGTLEMDGVRNGDICRCEQNLPGLIFHLYFKATVAPANMIQVSALNRSGGLITIPAGTELKILVLNFANRSPI